MKIDPREWTEYMSLKDRSPRLTREEAARLTSLENKLQAWRWGMGKGVTFKDFLRSFFKY